MQEQAEYKHCPKCQQDKPLSAFYPRKDRVMSYKSPCKDCCKLWQQEHYQRRGRGLSRVRLQELQRLQTERATPQPQKDRILRLTAGVKIRVSEYRQLLERQSGKCAICGNDSPGAHYRVLLVDHNHLTNKIRGLLCNECNIGLGRFKDSIDLLKRAIAYLEQA
jgi:hypothetical protein